MHAVVHATPATVRGAGLDGAAAVVIDVLRATTVAAVALEAGAARLVPVAEPGDAFAARDRLAAQGTAALLCGERGGVRIAGFDLGNSPLEFTPASVAGRVLVQCSTNGTGTMLRCAGARRVHLAALINAGAVAAALRHDPGPVHLVCSGKEGSPAAEDLAAAGRLLELLDPAEASGDSDAAVRAWAACAPDPAAFLAATEHGAYLASLGFGADLAACARRDACPVVPVLTAGPRGPLIVAAQGP